MLRRMFVIVLWTWIAAAVGCGGASPLAACHNALSADALGVTQGVIGRFYAVDPVPTCQDGDIQLVSVDIESPTRGDIATAFLEQEGQRTVTAQDGVFAIELEAAPWFACMNLDYGRADSYEVYCIDATVSDGAVELSFALTDSGISANNVDTGTISSVEVLYDPSSDDN